MLSPVFSRLTNLEQELVLFEGLGNLALVEGFLLFSFYEMERSLAHFLHLLIWSRINMYVIPCPSISIKDGSAVARGYLAFGCIWISFGHTFSFHTPKCFACHTYLEHAAS